MTDYIKDGLLYCGNCHTPKQWRGTLFGKDCIKPCLCKCEYERMEKEDADREQQEKMQRVKILRSMGFPDSEMQKWTFSLDDGQNEYISRVGRSYSENFKHMKSKGKGLLLYGGVGTGKSFISACICNSLIDRSIPCLMTNFARLSNSISGMYTGKQEYLDRLNQFDLLVIDDLGAERDTEYMGEIVQDIIDSRYRSGLPLIVTTNLTSDELKHPADIRRQRVYSRLFEMCIPVEVKGKDRRKEKLRADYAELRGVLNV